MPGLPGPLRRRIAHLRLRLNLPLRLTPVTPPGLERVVLPGGTDTVRSVDYRLFPDPIAGHRPGFRARPGWSARDAVTRDLDGALPVPWDAAYTEVHGQAFQPVKLWRNAVILANLAAAGGAESAAALTLLERLLQRMRDHTVTEGPAAFIENRFAFKSPDAQLPAPWVSAIANAFALLACAAARPHLDVTAEMQGYAMAFRRLHRAGARAPQRWISIRDRRGYLWFDEYPRPDGRATKVLNGHVFAVLALHEMHLVDPGGGHDVLVRAGAATVEAHADCFRRPGQRSLYTLNPRGKGDYLPNRAMRQFHQLYQLTGAPGFARHAEAFTRDAIRLVPAPEAAAVAAVARATHAARADFDASVGPDTVR